MSTTFKLPELGENVESGTVTSVLVSVGDSVDKDQPVIELETEKAVVEVPCSEAGTVSEISVKEGDEIKVGQAILVLDGATKAKEKKEEPGKEEEEEKEAAKKKEAKRETVKSKKEVEKKPEREEEPEEEESESAAKEEEQREDESEEEPEAREEEKRRPAETKAKKSRREEGEEEPEREQQEERESAGVRAAPSVRRLARQLGVDIEDVVASEGGRITDDDVKAYARAAMASTGRTAPAPGEAGPLPNFERWGKISREKMSNVRRVTAERLAASWPTVPQVTHYDKADITELEKFRKRYAGQVDAEGGKLTVTAILVKVLAIGLERFPQFNSSVDMDKSEIVYKRYFNIGVAVDTPRGLLVPSIKNVNQKSLTQVAVELNELSQKARDRKTSLDELSGSCMTITNLGGIGGIGFSPIIYPPEVAILGVSRAQIEPVHVDGDFDARTMMPVCVSYDHRVIDGADAARFLRWLCQSLEQPMHVFLD